MRAILMLGVAAFMVVVALALLLESTHSTPSGIVVGEAIVDNDDLETCCTFEKSGEQKTCSVIEPYDCTRCERFCP